MFCFSVLEGMANCVLEETGKCIYLIQSVSWAIDEMEDFDSVIAECGITFDLYRDFEG